MSEIEAPEGAVTNGVPPLDPANTGDQPIAHVIAAENLLKAGKTAASNEIAALEARIEEADRNAAAMRKQADSAARNLSSLRDDLAALTGMTPDNPVPDKQASLQDCNRIYLTDEKKRRKKQDGALNKATKALKKAFGPTTGRHTNRRVQKNLKANG